MASTTLLGLSVGTSAHAQTTPDDDDASDIDAIVVVGARGDARVRDVPASISVIDEETIAENFSTTPDPLDLLDALVPGLTPNSDSKSTCNSSLRGRTAAFLINGVPVGQNLRFSSCSDIYNISPYAISGIEVNRGATATYGYGAPGGIINITTRRGSAHGPHFNLTANTGFNPDAGSDSWRTNLYAGGGMASGAFDVYAGVGLSRSGLEHDPNGQILANQQRSDAYSLDISAGLQLSPNSELVGTVVYFLDDLGRNYTFGAGRTEGTPYVGPVVNYPYDSEHEAKRESLVATLAYRQDNLFLDSSLEASVFMQDQHEEARISSFLPEFAAFSIDGFGLFIDANEFDNTRWGVRTNITTPLGAWDGTHDANVTYGVDYISNTYFRPFYDYADTHTILGFFSPEVTLNTLSVFGQFRIPVNKWTFTGGLRHESYTGETGDRGADAGFVPGDGSGFLAPGHIQDFSVNLFNVGLIYDISDTLQIYGGFSQGAEVSELGRAARTVARLPPPNNVASAINLEPATSSQYELGLRGSTGDLNFSISAFYSSADLSADSTLDPSCGPSDVICPLVPLRQPTRIWGVEATMDYAVNSTLDLGAVLTYQNGEFNDPFDAPDAGYITTSSESISPARLSAYLNWRPTERVHTYLQASYTAARRPYAVNDYFAFPPRVNTDSYFVVNGSVGYDFGTSQLTLGAANLFNEKYVISTNASGGSFSDIYAAGRRISLTLSTRF